MHKTRSPFAPGTPRCTYCIDLMSARPPWSRETNSRSSLPCHALLQLHGRPQASCACADSIFCSSPLFFRRTVSSPPPMNFWLMNTWHHEQDTSSQQPLHGLMPQQHARQASLVLHMHSPSNSCCMLPARSQLCCSAASTGFSFSHKHQSASYPGH